MFAAIRSRPLRSAVSISPRKYLHCILIYTSACSTTESKIKNQNWPGKAEQEEEAKKKAEEKAKQDGKDQDQNGTEGATDKENPDQGSFSKQDTGDKKKDPEEPSSETKPEDADQKSVPGDDDKSNDQENGDPFTDLSPEEEKWFKRFMKEMDFFEKLENNPGEPSSEFAKHGLRALKEDFKPKDVKKREGKGMDAIEAARQERRLGKADQAAMSVQLDDQ